MTDELTAIDGSPALDERTAASLKLWVTLARAHAAVEAHAASDVARHGLTLAEFAILEVLYHKGQMLLGEIQRRILVSSGGITFLVDRLAGKGLVERRECKDDRRARYAALTPAGHELIQRIFPEHAARISDAVSALTLNQQRELTKLLKTLGKNAAEKLEGK